MDTKSAILARMETKAPFGVWTPKDFSNLGSRAVVDQTRSRLTASGDVRRIMRGFYDMPRISTLTGKPTNSDSHEIVNAIARRDHVRMMVDGITAANDLGLSDAVPAKIVLHTDARLRSIKLGGQTITFKKTAPSRLYWAGRPAMRMVQALYWLHDLLDRDRERLEPRIKAILSNPRHGKAIAADLRDGLTSLPAWMQSFLRPLLEESDSDACNGRTGHLRRGDGERQLSDFSVDLR